MQNQGGNMGGMKFVERTEMAIMQFVILSKAQQGSVTRENLQQTFRGNMQMQGDHLDHCIRTLVQEKHLQEEGNKLTITDDGREDVQKLQHLFLEIPNVVGQGTQGGQKQGMAQKTTAGMGGTGSPSGTTTGTTTGNQGNFGTQSQQGGSVGSNQPTTSGAQTGMKGGATSPATGGQQNKK